MTKTKAIKILNEALKPYRQRFNFDANLYRKGRIESHTSLIAHRKLTELDEALETILHPTQLELF